MPTEFTIPGGESLAFVKTAEETGGELLEGVKESETQTYPVRTRLPLIALITFLVGMALAFLWLHLELPFGNDRLQPGTNAMTARGVVVTPLEAGPAGLQAGDVVTAIGGRSLEAWLQAPGSSWQVGDTIEYSVIRQGQTIEVAVTLEPYPLGAVLRREWGTVIFRTISLLIAAYVFARRPRLITARLLFLGTAALFSAMPWSLGLHAGDFVNGVGVWLFHLTIVGAFMLAWIANFHFALVFPQPVGFLKKRWVAPLIYGLP
ncbi:MAG TPA: hypothetical protein VK879_15225, partial [Candidatus Sulfomarinibacteraceae bacterium]|nr:hypothetical protein [Candidatus Sulfomarinibacteraceae bacterium]